MGLVLEITDGEMKGSWTRVRQGLTIGRKKSTLNIRDSKISGQHAKIEERPDESFWLIDLGSHNGIKIGSEKVAELQLMPGLTFILGRTVFLVQEWSEEELAERAQLEVAPPPKKTWVEIIGALLKSARRQAKAEKREVRPFSPVLELEFIKGPQTGTKWFVGYGPRTIGASSPDLTLEDPQAPGVCFRLLPEETGATLKNESDVRVNGKFVETKRLMRDDLIEIKNTQIRVRFYENN